MEKWMVDICGREAALDGTCQTLRRIGFFGRHMMLKFGLMRYAGKTGKTRIVIEYNNDTGEGWMRSVSESEE